jgi:phosphate transport system substrate-binding protein
MTSSAFYVHPDLRLRGLSVAQLQAIYTGKLTNWSAVGGPNLRIVPVSQDSDVTGSTLSLLLRNFFSDRQKLARSIQQVRDTTAAVRKVAATPGAIGFGTQALVAHQRSIRLIGLAKEDNKQYIQPMNDSGQINKTALQEGKYPLIQRIFVVVRQDGTLDEMAGTAYANLLLSEKGQALIDQAGYLPICSQ